MKRYPKELYTLISPKSPIAESFRILRTNITYLLRDRPKKVILISSVDYESGKSMVAANLGIVLAQADNRVLIIDGDLRNPKMNKYFTTENKPGLVNFLIGNSLVDETIRNTFVKGLFSLPSGPIPYNPSELLGTKRMQNFLEAISQKYDVVLIDTPPIIAFADAAVLAPLVDGVVLVVKSGHTSIDMIKDARAQLEKINAKILGIVLNEVKISRSDFKYYYHSQSKTTEEITSEIAPLTAEGSSDNTTSMGMPG